MATRSHIGIINKDGSIEVVYCHHDGYLSFTGQRLVDSHNNVPSVRALLKIGNMTFVGAAMQEYNSAMTFKNMTEYLKVIKDKCTDIEYFYLYSVNKSVLGKKGWWFAKYNDYTLWNRVESSLLNVKMTDLV